MIVFDELAFAKRVENSEITDTYYSFKKGVILAKYYFSQGYSEKEVRNKIESKFSILDGSYNYNIKYIKINRIIEQAKQSPELVSKSINFSKEELDFIHSFKDVKIERIYFILFCISKFYGNLFYFYDREIFELAQIPWNGQYSKTTFSFLIQNGYLYIEERGMSNNRKIRKLFYSLTDKVISLFNEDNIVLTISNYNNIVFYYLNYFKLDKFIFCKDCGSIELWQKNKIRCPECSKARTLEIKRKKWMLNRTVINEDGIKL